MFTGIVEERGRAVAVGSAGTKLEVLGPKVADDARAGDSISVNGVCLTVASREGEVLAFDVAQETLARTALGELRAGAPVNLERPVTLATRLGGHLVQGHVDGVGTVETAASEGDGIRMRIRVPEGVARYVVEKGSVAVDGVSLTVAGASDGSFEVALVPHTLAATTLGDREPGDLVNLEVDVLAKYVERLVGNGR
ncbi:MAG: riboflavin synthase [Actinomycetota bacterium]